MIYFITHTHVHNCDLLKYNRIDSSYHSSCIEFVLSTLYVVILLYFFSGLIETLSHCISVYISNTLKSK